MHVCLRVGIVGLNACLSLQVCPIMSCRPQAAPPTNPVSEKWLQIDRLMKDGALFSLVVHYVCCFNYDI